jgi:hypothetical protein
MPARERRNPGNARAAELRAALTPAQRRALETLEHFGWTLKFVRRPMFLDPVPVVVDRSGERHAVLEPDGSVDENTTLRLRD